MTKAKEVIDAFSGNLSEVPKKVWKDFYTAKGQIERMSQNYPIQGTGAEMTKIACILFSRAVKANKLDASLVNAVHDELVVETKVTDAEKVKLLLEQAMKDAGRLFIKSLPIEVEAKVTEFWDH